MTNSKNSRREAGTKSSGFCAQSGSNIFGGRYSILSAYLSTGEIESLITRAPNMAWEVGQGTGYAKARLDNEPMFAALIETTRQYLVPDDDGDGVFDAYLLRYPNRSYLPPHRDLASLFGRRYKRFDALVQAPDAGGVLRFGRAEVPLQVGDAVIFYPDEIEQSVSLVVGERLVFSLGAWL